MPSLTLAPDLTTHYEDHYFGPPWIAPEVVLLVHGAADTGASWFAWVPRLTPHFRVLRPDLRGFGESTIPPDGYAYSVVGYADDLLKFLDKLDVPSAHLIGAKIGGTVAIQFASSHPERVRTLTVVSSPVRSHNPDGSGDTRGNAARLAGMTSREWALANEPTRLGSSASPEETTWWTEASAAANHSAMVGIAAMLGTLGLYDVLPHIQAPTLVITARGSSLQSLEVAVDWQRLIPNSRLEVLDSDAYHPAAAHPQNCCDLVVPFLLAQAGKNKPAEL